MPQILLTLHPGTTHRAQLVDLTNSALPGFITTALVLLTLTDAVAGTPLTGISWPVTLSPVATSEGDYEATLSSALDITLGQRVVATAVVLADGGSQRTFTERLMVTDG